LFGNRSPLEQFAPQNSKESADAELVGIGGFDEQLYLVFIESAVVGKGEGDQGRGDRQTSDGTKNYIELHWNNSFSVDYRFTMVGVLRFDRDEPGHAPLNYAIDREGVMGGLASGEGLHGFGVRKLCLTLA
jgi:hypothetical protein